MATPNAPERLRGEAEIQPENKLHCTRVRLAVSAQQLAIVRAAVAFETVRGRWPTSHELAASADIAAPVVWSELRKLVALGCVVWTKLVTVARMPDGVVFGVGP